MSDAAPTYIVGTWGFGFWEPAALVLLLGWAYLAFTLTLRNGPMERPSRVAQLYGYTVCLIALITILVTLPNLIENLFRLGNPLQTHTGFPEPSLSSFEAYKATYQRAQEPFSSRDQPATTRPQPTDAELRKAYEALRNDRIEHNRFEARRSLISEVLLLGLAVALFLGHWRWLRRLGDVTVV
jgi:hypothetical protein